MASRETPIVEFGKEKYLILHNIRSVYNVGAIFRTADAIGISKIYLTGYTPTPLDRFGQPRSDIAKSALGTEKTVPWKHAKNPTALLKRLKKEKISVVGLEQSARSVDYKKFRPLARTALLVGSEVKGLSKNLRDSCDTLVEIPMRGSMVRQAHHPRNTKRGKESLNVSVATGIALFRLFDL